jgi:hypothetical protein
MHKSSKTFQFIFFLCMVVFSSFKIALPMGKTSIIISDPPLDDVYMMKNNISQGFCCVFDKPERTIHTGIDIAVPAGTPVYSIVDGKVHKDNETWDENNYWDSFLIIEHECQAKLSPQRLSKNSSQGDSGLRESNPLSRIFL